MTVRDVRIKEFRFPAGSLIADSDGRFSVFSEHAINGRIMGVFQGDNNYTETGSLVLFCSGIANSGTNLGDIGLRYRAGSTSFTVYPSIFATQETGARHTVIATQPLCNGPLRLVGSGLGDSKSGTEYVVRYI